MHSPRYEQRPFEGLFFLVQLLYLCFALGAMALDAHQVYQCDYAHLMLDRLHRERHGEKINHLEIFQTFDGGSLINYINVGAVDDPDSTINLFTELDDCLRDYVCDASSTSNFNKSHTAEFYRRLDAFLPCLLDVVIEAPDKEKRLLATTLQMLEREDRQRMALKAEPVMKRCVHAIDRSSV